MIKCKVKSVYVLLYVRNLNLTEQSGDKSIFTSYLIFNINTLYYIVSQQ